MPSNPILLSITIPTYARGAYLTQLLESLAPQLAGKCEVELLISDNASPDDTPEVVLSFQRRGLACRYLRNQTNIGSDANFLQCFQEASGKYVWLIGDDDIVPSGAIDRLLCLIKGHDLDLIYLRPTEFREEPLRVWQADARGRHAQVIQNAPHYASLVGNMFTLTTCNIVNKEHLLQLVPTLDDQILRTNLIQLAWTFPLLSHLRQGLYVFDRLISIRASNRSGYSVSRVFGTNFKYIIDLLLGSRPALAHVMHSDIVGKCLPHLILEVRQHRFGDFEPEDFHASLKPVYGHMLRYWLALYPIAVGPLWFAEFWFRLIDRLNAVKPALELLRFSIRRTRNKIPC